MAEFDRTIDLVGSVTLNVIDIQTNLMSNIDLVGIKSLELSITGSLVVSVELIGSSDTVESDDVD